MRTLLPFLACVLMVLTAWIGTASAVEFVACPEMAQTMQMHACDDAIRIVMPAATDIMSPRRRLRVYPRHRSHWKAPSVRCVAWRLSARPPTKLFAHRNPDLPKARAIRARF
jgi:hypothetical protein